MPSALIFGIGGQDGSYLARLLLDKGYAVYGTSRNGDDAALGNLAAIGIRQRVVVFSVNIADYASVLKVVADVAPDEIYNLAGQTSVGQSFYQPVEALNSITGGTFKILEAIRTAGGRARFFNACSSECFGNTATPANATTRFAPQSPYAIAKVAGFHAVSTYRKAYGLPLVSGILFNHESPLRASPFVTRKIIRAAVAIANGSQERLTLGNVEVRRDWGFAPDYVEAMWLMLQQAEHHDLVVATGELHSLADFAALAFSSVGLDWRAWTDIDSRLFRPYDLDVTLGDPAEAETRLGWRARTRFPQLIEKLVDAERTRVRAPGA